MQDIPRPALVLGAAGLIPFFAGAVGLWMLNQPYAGLALVLELQYAAIILSFLGAAHWGPAIAGHGGDRPSWSRLGWPVAPALAGWAAIQFPPALGLLLLAVAFAVAWAVDRWAVHKGFAPAWYAPLRKGLSIGVLLCLGASLLALARVALARRPFRLTHPAPPPGHPKRTIPWWPGGRAGWVETT